MAEGFHIASAWVSVEADTSGLQGEVEDALQRSGGSISVPVAADTASLKEQIDEALADDGGTVTVTAEPDTSGFRGKLDAALAADGQDSVTVTADPDTSGFRDRLDADLTADAAGEHVTVTADPDATGFREKLRALVDAADISVSVRVNVDDSGGGSGSVFDRLRNDAAGAGSDSGGIFSNAFVQNAFGGKKTAITTGIAAGLATDGRPAHPDGPRSRLRLDAARPGRAHRIAPACRSRQQRAGRRNIEVAGSPGCSGRCSTSCDDRQTSVPVTGLSGTPPWNSGTADLASRVPQFHGRVPESARACGLQRGVQSRHSARSH